MLLLNLAIGTLVIALTVLVHTLGLVALTRAMAWVIRWLNLNRHALGRSLSMLGTVLGLFALHTIEIWLWAFAYMLLGAHQSFDEALYFSTSTFSTVGYGDVVLLPEWRLLGALEGVGGFILIGWSTAYLVAASTRHGPFRIGVHF
ncbi:MAG: metal transporter [Aurantimonas sp.]|nr:metal transporter [Aurantimonas sp.]MCD1643474.1 potassium channel family protein [Aurantimonas coralicida]